MVNKSEKAECYVELGLDEWMRAWHDAAVKANYIRSPYSADAEALDRLRGYFHCGLSPAEAALACFGQMH